MERDHTANEESSSSREIFKKAKKLPRHRGNGAIRDVAEACGYGKATAVRVSSYRPLVCKRLVRGRYEYTPNTGSWRTKRYVVETCRQDAYYGSNFHEIARSP